MIFGCIIVGMLSIAACIALWIDWECTQHKNYMEQCRRHDEAFTRRDPETYV